MDTRDTGEDKHDTNLHLRKICDKPQTQETGATSTKTQNDTAAKRQTDTDPSSRETETRCPLTVKTFGTAGFILILRRLRRVRAVAAETHTHRQNV